jgi:hypothetical protein
MLYFTVWRRLKKKTELGRELWKSFSVCNLEITATVFWSSGDRREA